MSDLREHLIHHLTCEAKPYPRSTVCKELERIGSVSQVVPSVASWEWSEAITELISEGLATETAYGVAIIRVTDPEVHHVLQGELF